MADQSALPAQVFLDPLDVSPRLAELGLNIEVLLEAISNGAQHASSCTANDPLMLPSTLFWGKAVRDLRDTLVPLGWRVDNTRNFPTIVHPSGQWAVGVCSGDENTGRPGISPHSRNPKGTVTKDITDQNQMSFTEIAPDFMPPMASPPSPKSTWLLLFHSDRTTHEIRSELSLPVEMNAAGRVVEWNQRLILPSIPGHQAIVIEDHNEEIDFDVERRAL
jgi:hypothetical protein